MLAGFFILVFFYFIIASFDRWMFARGVPRRRRPLGVADRREAEKRRRGGTVGDGHAISA